MFIGLCTNLQTQNILNKKYHFDFFFNYLIYFKAHKTNETSIIFLSSAFILLQECCCHEAGVHLYSQWPSIMYHLWFFGLFSMCSMWPRGTVTSFDSCHFKGKLAVFSKHQRLAQRARESGRQWARSENNPHINPKQSEFCFISVVVFLFCYWVTILLSNMSK